MARPWLTATITNPPPRGYIHLPYRWWVRPHKHVYPSLTWDEIAEARYNILVQRNHLYSCRSGSIWVANNWWLYRIRLEERPAGIGPACIVLPMADPETGIWYYVGSPVVLEPVTRLQLRMELLWNPDR